MAKTVYVKNNKKYAMSFNVTREGSQKTFTFDCLRRFDDTGNIATTGITAINEEDYKFLLTVPVFERLIKKGELELSKTDGLTSMAKNVEVLAEENRQLKAQLEAKTEEAAKATNEEMSKLADENASLKAQLEALKKKTDKKTDKKTEG